MPEIPQGALQATVTPSGVLFGHAHDQLLDFLSDTRSAKLLSLRAAVKLLRDQSVVPAQEGLCVTRVATALRRFRPSGWASVARRRRSVSVRRSRRPPSWALRTRFSSRRYVMTCCWCRWSHPATMVIRTWRIIALLRLEAVTSLHGSVYNELEEFQ